MRLRAGLGIVAATSIVTWLLFKRVVHPSGRTSPHFLRIDPAPVVRFAPLGSALFAAP